MADADVMRDVGKIRARARDLDRNHPYARQAKRVSRLGTIGKRLKYSCRPDHRFLGIDFDEAFRWSQEFERVWETYAHGTGFNADAARRLNFTQKMALAHDTMFVDGEALVTAEWDMNRKWRTCFQSVDVDRLSNPHGAPESRHLKGGVVLDRLSAPVGYFIRNGHPSDYGLVDRQNLTWSLVHRFTPWGRPIALHAYEQERPGQTRGVSALASVISAMKMGQEYTETALQQAVLQASYAAVLTSQQNYRDALEAISGVPADEAPSLVDLAEDNLAAALEHHERIRLQFQGAQIPVLWPGEELKIISPGNGAAALGEFQSHATREYSAGAGTDPIQVSQDYSNVSYSAAKMSAATSYRQFEERRERLIACVGMPMVAAFLEELVFTGAIDLPKGVSPLDFYDAQDALIRGTFITQGAPLLEPVKERQAQKIGLEIGLETLQDLAAAEGKDYIEIADQQQREVMVREERGLPNPALAGTADTLLEHSSDDATVGG
ncbi:MAG: phage portal protein [Hyphomicrobiaceae bacterium]